MKESVFAQGKVFEKIAERGRVRGPGLGDALERVLDLRGMKGASRLLLDPIRGIHRGEKGIVMLRQSKRRTSSAERPMSNSETA